MMLVITLSAIPLEGDFPVFLDGICDASFKQTLAKLMKHRLCIALST